MKRVVVAVVVLALAACALRKSAPEEAGGQVAQAPMLVPTSESAPSATPPADIPVLASAETKPSAAGTTLSDENTEGANAPPGVPAKGPFPNMYFRDYGVNPTVETDEEPVSTFAADVDTASYALARAYLWRNALPPEEAVRVEEFVNAFDYAYRPPEQEAFAVQVEAFPSPNRRGYHVLHVGLKGREVRAAQRKRANLVFTIDVSGSMNQENRLGLAKQALGLLVEQLGAGDSVAIVVYGDRARTVLSPTPAERRERILEAIASLRPEGATNVQAGLELAYDVAGRAFVEGGINRVVLCSDGVANNGITTADGIFARVKERAARGIALSAVGFGMGNYNDELMERLADQGNGNYAYVDRLDEARRIFVEQLTGTLQIIAKDVKLQLEFDRRAVARYRLLGFENRLLKKNEFADDRVDAGEIGAGHAVTAIYELKLRDKVSALPSHFATIRVRHKDPDGQRSALVEKKLPSEVIRDSYLKTSGPTRVSMVAAAFGEKLRGSYWARNLSYDDILRLWDQIPEPLRQRKDVGELRELVQKARALDRRIDRFEKVLPVAMMDFDRVPVLR